MMTDPARPKFYVLDKFVMDVYGMFLFDKVKNFS